MVFFLGGGYKSRKGEDVGLSKKKKSENDLGMIANEVLENNPDVEYYGLYLHRHIPETMFMRTYPKMYPGVPVPSYQAGIVLRKK